MDIQVEGRKLNWNQDVIYLGQLISFKERSEKEAKRRCAVAWRKYWSLKFILKNNKVSLANKIKIVRSCVFPTLTYGSQTWSITQKIIKKITSTQSAIERNLLSISRLQKIKNKIIRGTTRLDDVMKIIKELKWKWAGHIARLKDGRWTKTLTKWVPRWGVRKVGRQKMRWKEDVVKVSGENWMRMAEDREKWAHLGEAFAQHWA